MDNLDRFKKAKLTRATENWAKRITENKAIYLRVANEVWSKMPWQVIGVIHMRESSLSFKKHLHNGDPLSQPTVNVPAGLPKVWSILSPLDRTWERSAADALNRKNVSKVKWNVEGTMEFLERYNGLGYRKKRQPSPYLWAGTDQYVAGKYVADGKYDPGVVDKQNGCMAVLIQMDLFKRVSQPMVLPQFDSEEYYNFTREEKKKLSPNFMSVEFQCKCGRCKEQIVSNELIKKLEKLRQDIGNKALRITSGYRCRTHNKNVGGSINSQHTQGNAVDVRLPKGMAISSFLKFAEKYFNGIGRYSNRLHVDVRKTKARW